MIDFILALFTLAVFYGGFKTGNKFKTLSEAWSALIIFIKEAH